MALASIHYRDSRGYGYVEASDAWKKVCSHLPCFEAMAWHDYETKVYFTLEDGRSPIIIDGKPAIVQLWKGLVPKSQRVPFADDILGGVGAEIGVYRADDDAGWLAKRVSTHPLIWWPYTALETTLQYQLMNPLTNEVFFETRPETTYWLCKWMDPNSYKKYGRDQELAKQRVPDRPIGFRMVAKIFGRDGQKVEFNWS